MTIKSRETIEADRLRAQKAASTDPDRLEREAQRIERQSGLRYLCDLPGDGPWKLTQFNGMLVAVSEAHGCFAAEITEIDGATKMEWIKVTPVWP